MTEEYPQASHRRWLVLLAALLGMAVTASLGRWQLGRAAQKEALQTQLLAQGRLAPLGTGALARSAEEAAAQQARRVRLRGRWLAAATVYLDNRPQGAQAGFIVVTPLLLGSGDAVAVQRGWAPRDARSPLTLPPVQTPAGEVEVDGRVAPAPSQRMAFGPEQPGPIRQNLDLAEYGREAGVLLRPLSVLQTTPLDGQDGLQRQWPAPALKVETHYGYAAQWFGLCALIAGLYVWFQLIRPRLGPRSARA